MKMYKEVQDTVHWLYGIDVFNKTEFDVPEHLVSLFVNFGYKIKQQNKQTANEIQTKEQEIHETKTETKKTHEFRCKKCGKTFPTVQQLAIHSKQCKV